MKAAIISLGSKSSEWTAEAMKKYFDEVDLLNIRRMEVSFSGSTAEVLYEGKPIKKYDCIYAKGSHKYAPLLTAITSILWDECYMPIAPSTFTIAHDKLLTQLELQKHNIPMPKTYLSSTVEEAKNLLSKVHYPIIMKFPKGTHGKGVLVADSQASASSMLDALSALKQPFILQEFVETSKNVKEGGNDIRAIVIGNKVVAAMRRRATDNDVRANLHTGGKAESVILDAYSQKIAVKVAKCIGADIAGIDILESVKGPMVIEANSSPGLQGITKVSNVDVADEIAKFLYKKTKEKLELHKKRTSSQIMSEINHSRGGKQKFISNLDFRGVRILLPELITKITGFEDDDNFEVEVDKGHLTIKKFEIE